MKEDEVIKEFLNNELKDIWKLIIDNNIDMIQKNVNKQMSIIQSVANILSSKKNNNTLFTILKELFENNTSQTLENQLFRVTDSNSEELFRNLTRLLFAIEINGNYPQIADFLQHLLYKSTEVIAEEIKNKTGKSPINAQVWFGGAEMRAAFSYLGYYYEKKNLLNAKLWVWKQRTKITVNIMEHYKNLVGSDVLEVALLEEKLNLLSEAQAHYEAFIAYCQEDFKWFIENTKEVPIEEEYEVFKILLLAYEGIDRVTKVSQINNIELIKQMLSRTKES